MLGYAGTILYVDLTTGKTRTEKLNEETAKKFVGGIGLGMKLWLSNSKAGVNPLSPENPLVLSLGPVSGTMFPTGGNGHAFISKSPATGGVGEAVSHGTFGAELKRAGYDAIVFTGKAEKPVYIWIDDESIQVLDASTRLGQITRRNRRCNKRRNRRLLRPSRINRFSRRKTIQNSQYY